VLAILAVLALPPIVRWFGLRLQRLVFVLSGSEDAALYVYHFVLLPGTVLHELAHWFAAKLLGVRTGKLSLMPVRQGKVARFGAVQIGLSDPIRGSLIGAAPLLAGVLVVLGIARWRFGVHAAVPATWADFGNLWHALGAAPDAALWLYLILSVANSMLPSDSDRRSWRWVGFGLLVAIIALQLMGYLDNAFASILPWIGRTASAIGFVALVTVICDLALGLLLFGIEMVIGALWGRWADVA